MQASLMFIVISVNFIVYPNKRKLKFFLQFDKGKNDRSIKIVTRKEVLKIYR